MFSMSFAFERLAAMLNTITFAPHSATTEVVNLRGAPPRLTVEQRALLAEAARLPVARPEGLAREVAPGVFNYSGLVRFKMSYFVMQGSANELVWQDGHISAKRINVDRSKPFHMSADMTNLQISEVMVLP